MMEPPELPPNRYCLNSAPVTAGYTADQMRSFYAEGVREGMERADQDAKRYQWLRHKTGAGQSTIGSPGAFRLPDIPPAKGANLMRGSVAWHLDDAIDAAIREAAKTAAP
jgi:hypothetical protein